MCYICQKAFLSTLKYIVQFSRTYETPLLEKTRYDKKKDFPHP